MVPWKKKQNKRFRVKKMWVQVQALLLMGRESLGRSFNLSETFLHPPSPVSPSTTNRPPTHPSFMEHLLLEKSVIYKIQMGINPLLSK